jgi:hypothetical protein
LIRTTHSFLKSRFFARRSRYAYINALSTESAAVLNNLLLPPRNPLASFSTLFLRRRALNPLFTLMVSKLLKNSKIQYGLRHVPPYSQGTDDFYYSHPLGSIRRTSFMSDPATI